ncbi:MAG: M20/M25/M40 family metallo-hydrolase [Oscillospiraceae bacterium]
MIFWIILAIIILFVAVLCVRAAGLKPIEQSYEGQKAVELPQKAREHLAALIRVPTVSNYDIAAMDEEKFSEFRNLLAVIYPTVHANAAPVRIGHTGMLFLWKGQSSAKPTVLMSHYDVVPANADRWQHEPFCGEVFDGELWGRGTLDTKITAMAIFEAAEALMKKGFVPKNDIYISLAGDEEVSGESTPSIVAYMKEKGIKPNMVLDEGGAIVEGIFPGVAKPIAVVGIGEKGMMNVQLKAKSAGGHASTPKLPSALGQLGKAMVSCEKHPFKAHITKPVTELFTTVGAHAPFALRIVFANLWCFGGILKLISPKLGGEVAAMMRTTMAFTMASGSKQINVLPNEASVGLNMRLINVDTPTLAEEHLNKVINNDNIKVEVTHRQPASPYSDTNGENWQALKKAISVTWPQTIVSPYLMIACSDSRHYSAICRDVYKFSAMELSKAQRDMIHNDNERIPLETIDKTVEFYLRFESEL